MITAAMFYAHLRFAIRPKPKGPVVTVITISVLITSFSAHELYGESDEFSYSPLYIASLKPATYVIEPLATTEEFFSDMSAIEREIQNLIVYEN